MGQAYASAVPVAVSAVPSRNGRRVPTRSIARPKFTEKNIGNAANSAPITPT